MTDHRPLRALLVEDDPVSRAWLQAALERVPASVDAAADCAGATRLAAVGGYGLLVVDANLPDGRGDDWLRVRRAAGDATPAIAHTAAREASEHERLLAAGFLEVLVKPLATPDVVAAVRAVLGRAPPPMAAAAAAGGAPLWDDEAALRALLGDRGHLVALRGLFRPELESMREAARSAMDAGDAAALRSLLHRLRASCGFVGATRLGEAAARLADTGDRAAWNHFEATIAGTLASFPER